MLYEVITLSEKFIELVDVLSEIGENCGISNDSNVLRLYELWMKTGSRRLARRLHRITSYNVCYTKLLRSGHAVKPVRVKPY